MSHQAREMNSSSLNFRVLWHPPREGSLCTKARSVYYNPAKCGKGPSPGRAAQVVPEARLIALLRNPIDRAYSHYQQVARKGREPLTFEEAIGAKKTQSSEEEGWIPYHKDSAGLDDSCAYLTRGIYVDQLLRWSRYFNDEQMLVLKSEDFFERTPETLKRVLHFLEPPDWEPEAWEKVPKKRDKGEYEGMNPDTRRRLEELFEPHNRRLYEYLGADFGW